MSLCVNTKSKEFQDMAKRLDMSPASLENVIHEYMNAEGDGKFPSDSIVLERLAPAPLEEATRKSYDLWRQRYSRPISTNTHQEAVAVQQEASKYYPIESVTVKETFDGHYEVQVGKFSPEALKKIATTPIKEQYKGKLVFAQSGTGKTSIADNINVIDSDYLLGQVLGVPTALAGDAFKLLGFSEKSEVGAKYRELIRQEIAAGKTVVTANISMLPEADVIVYNESAELTTERTSANDRTNQFSNTEYQAQSLQRINEFIAQNPGRETHRLNKEQHLSDVILTDTNFNVFTERIQNNSLNELLNDFMNNFGISIEEYHGEMPLFDALNRVIKARTAEEVPDTVGEAIAFMMQYNPDVKRYISERIIEDGKATREEMFDEKGRVKHKYNTSDFAATKEPYFKEVGKAIAEQLRRLYTEAQTIHTEEIKDPLIKRIWNVISEFIGKLFSKRQEVEALNEVQQRLNSYAQRVARNVLANNEGLVIASLSKPSKGDSAPELAIPVNVNEALENNPYERDILMQLSEEGIALAGSTSIAAFSRVLRPKENPLHDLDFQAPGRSKEELEGILEKHFGNFVETNTISNKETGEVGTRSYLVLDRPFHFEESLLGASFQVIVDNTTGDHLGVLKGKTELELNAGINGKVLDFFVNEDQLAPLAYNYKGETFLMGNPKQALSAKIAWMRIKDIFDYNRAVPYDHNPTTLPIALKETSESFNIEGKSLKEFLRDKGLIHTFDPSMGDADSKAMYVTKGDGTYSMASKINDIYTVLRMYGVSPGAVTFSRTKSGNAMKIDFVSTDAIERATGRDLKQIRKVVDFLQARIPALKGRVNYVTIEEASKALGRKLRNGENSFVKDSRIYLIGRKFTEDIAIEECLHPFTATLKYENTFLYNRLVDEAMRAFPKLWEDIVSNYSEAEGFTHEDRLSELVTQTLARNFREEFNNTKETERKTLAQYISQFVSWFKRLFYRVNPVTGNQIVDLDTINPTMSYKELAGLINTSDSEFAISFEEKTRFNKERATISPEEKDFITETIVIPGVSSDVVQRVANLWDEALSLGTAYEDDVTIPYSTWKSLEVNSPIRVGKSVDREKSTDKRTSESSLSSLAEIYRDEYDVYFGYNKADKTITVPKRALVIAQIIKEATPLMDYVLDALGSTNFSVDDSILTEAEAVEQLINVEEMSFEDFLSIIGGEFYYSDSRQGQLFDEYGNTTKEAEQLNGISQVKQQPVRSSLSQFQEKTTRMTQQLDNLLSSSLMSNSEVRHVAEQVVYFISDTISEYLEDPTKILDNFPELATVKDKPMTDAEKQAFIEKVKAMSRVEVAKLLTPERLIEFAKYRLFTREGNNNINNRNLLKKAQLIFNNFEAIIRFANDAFAAVEDFSITSNGNTVNIVEDVVPVMSEDLNGINDTSNILENEGSLQEHWQIESRTLDVMSSMSQLVKQVLNRCFQMQIDENGNKIKVPSEFGIAERVNAKDATASILRWTRGADSLSSMLEILKEKAKENLWLEQVVEKLEDTSGDEADFQSQFYGVFAKAFQPYSVVLKEKNEKTGDYEYRSIQVNQHPALTDAVQGIEVAYKTNTHPLFDNMRVRKDVLETLSSITSDLINMANKSLEENDRAEVVTRLARAAAILGYNVEESDVNLALDSTETFHKMVNSVREIFNNLSKSKDKENYDPFKFRGEGNIGNYLKNFLTPLTERLEETAVSSFYDSGKMYQSYVTPSYLTVLMNHFQGEDAKFQQFLDTEYGQYEWFKNADGTWKNMWLETLDGMSQQERKDLFKHKVQLNFNKHNYMRSMSDTEYALSVLSEYASEMGDAKGTTVPVWYRIPMMSNKPSSEFIRMFAYTGSYMKPKLTEGFTRIFQQELSRIQTVAIRDYGKKDPNFIKNFDKNGKKFIMLDFFNKYLKGGSQANSELGRLINKAIEEGTSFDPKTNKGLTVEDNARLDKLVGEEIVASMDARADRIIAEWKTNGIFEGAKQIANMGKEDAVVDTKLREFIWNDAFASMNILELTVTDPAYYKDAEDLQKRLAQIHAPGIRANVEATDYSGHSVTDGKFRTILLKDFDDFISNIKANLRVVFDRKLEELSKTTDKNSSRYKAAEATYNNIIDQFDQINVADAQGYSSPTSYRKKALIFGKWSRSAEKVYEQLRSGNYNYRDLQTAFQPLKPFVYGQITKPGIDVARRDIATPLSNLKVPVQFKNSEYLLVMADAILQNEDTGMPNILRAIYQVMEESAERTKEDGYAVGRRGIDTIQFESTCKSGLMAPIDIKKFYGMKGGETAAKLALEQAIYKEDGSYNTDTYVYEVPFENYAIQQDVPEHFKNHSQAHGSQIRYIIASDLENFDSAGNPVTYNFFDRGREKRLSAEDFKREYEANISANIEQSIDELSEQLGIKDYFLSRKDRNIALSEILLGEIFSSPRYGAELAAACTVNEETGEFNIPLGDPIQSKRIEQLINSVVKNRINKQELAGGPVVQVTNFGTSRELNIRFHDKNGGMLMTRAEWEEEKAKLPSEVYHYSDEVMSAFTHKEDNYFSKVKGGSKNAIFFTDNAAPKEGTVLARNHKYAVRLSADKVKVVYGTKDDFHKRGSSYTQEVNTAEQEGYDAVRFIGLDDNQERGQNITVIFDPSKATILRDEGRVTSQESLEDTYENYVKNNQAGIAYYEVFAPIFSNELFEKFADRNGNIDIDAIEMINPELLQMIGYRIPTEDKYSMAPLKIVGFLPREAGDGIMLPNDITLLTGSDFDVDKFYLMRKEINIAMRQLGQEEVSDKTFDEQSQEFIKNNRDEVRRYLKSNLPNRDQIQLTEAERQEVIDDIEFRKSRKVNYRIDAENRRHQNVVDDINNHAAQAREALGENATEQQLNQITRSTERALERENNRHENLLDKFNERNEYERQQTIDKALEKAREEKLNKIIDDFLNSDIFTNKKGNEQFQQLKKLYINYMFRSFEDTQGTTYRNNKIINMSWAVLTNETTASKMLNPGGFEPQKSMGYLVSAFQNPANNFTWEELSDLADGEVGLLDGKIVPVDTEDAETGTAALKTLCYTEKNLCFIDTHLQFYKQNSAAATALGMAAVQKVAHAVLESNGYMIDVDGALSFADNQKFSIAGKDFYGKMVIDAKYNDEGALIGRTLGEFVAMFADAVKDPVANLMNINNTTMPIVTTLIRFGMPFKQAAMFISQPIIREVLATYNSENVTNFTTLSEVIKNKLDEITKDYNLADDSRINDFDSITEEELIDNLNPRVREENAEDTAVADYKVLRFFQYLDTLAKTLKSPTYATRFNSMSNAVGPLVIDNLIMEYKATDGNFDYFYDSNGNKADFNSILREHPILDSFYKALDISNTLLDGMPANSSDFRQMLRMADADLKKTLYGDRKTLSELSDFYQSYLLVASGAIPVEATRDNKYQGLRYYLEQFPKDFLRGNAKEVFRGNALIDAIKVDVQKDRTVLKIDTTGLTTQDKEKLGDGWADLYKSGERGKKLAEHLFYYNFWRTGIGFSPKSFMGLFPTRLKSEIRGYNETFTVHSDRFAANVVGQVVLDQFVRNNADNNKLAPKIKTGKEGANPKKTNEGYIFDGKNYEFVKGKYYIKIKSGGKDILLKRVAENKESRTATYTELSLLGNNGEYFEASINPAYTPVAQTAQVKEQKNDGQIEEQTTPVVEHSETATTTNEALTEQQKLDRATRIRNKILELFMMAGGRTLEQAKQKVAEFKAKSQKDKNALRNPMKKFFKTKLAELGIEANDSLLEEMYNELC